MAESTTQTITPIAQEEQPDIVLKSVSDSAIFELYSGDTYQSLEDLQNQLLWPLARLIAELARAEFELDKLDKCEVNNEL